MCLTPQNVRVPKRYDGRARGFAFVEYERASDASSALRALGAAHLYGRHPLIDWAEIERGGRKLVFVSYRSASARSAALAPARRRAASMTGT